MVKIMNVEPIYINKNNVEVINRANIDLISEVSIKGVAHQLGEHRDFKRHAKLKDFIPCRGEFSLSWTKLEKNQTLEKHTHPVKSMIVICSGRASLIGQEKRLISEGDVVIVPPYFEHGFVADQGEVLHALSIQFEGDGLYENLKNYLLFCLF